ncbi:hypothetical protein HPB48_015698 [Haemaphysalis longicornis]|uniref:Endonuclease/exonuclease/phosphatase domain-containing protein n=1 Tax=Haemaphysalis longicornis TaxID=44386 RepID=A0A9J6GVH5_HAELO|nr:hypothetical protein HPB48_015698 [Haemaphysalis longicornis]
MRQLRALYPRDEVVIGGDSMPSARLGISRHQHPRRNLEESAEDADLILVNDLSCPTRLGQSPSQRDTIPDLTWATPSMVSLWKCDSSSWGSDHYPIWITLSGTARKINKKVRYVDWPRFRELQFFGTERHRNANLDSLTILLNRILIAANGATTVVEVDQDILLLIDT